MVFSLTFFSTYSSSCWNTDLALLTASCFGMVKYSEMLSFSICVLSCSLEILSAHRNAISGSLVQQKAWLSNMKQLWRSWIAFPLFVVILGVLVSVGGLSSSPLFLIYWCIGQKGWKRDDGLTWINMLRNVCWFFFK